MSPIRTTLRPGGGPSDLFDVDLCVDRRAGSGLADDAFGLVPHLRGRWSFRLFVEAVERGADKQPFGVRPSASTDGLVRAQVLVNTGNFVVVPIPIGHHLAVRAKWLICEC